MFNLKDLAKLMLETKQVVTKADVDYYQAHPEELERITDKEMLHLKFLNFFFLFGLFLVLASRIVIYMFADILGGFMTEVVLETSFEMGNAVLGGVTAAFLLEYLQKKQYEENLRYRHEVLHRIELRDSKG